MELSAKEVFQRLLRAGLQAADPEGAVRNHVERRGNDLIAEGRPYPLDRFRRVFVFGAGKAGAPMARALEDILGDRLTGGWVSVKYGHGLPTRKVRILEAGHPVPDDAGLSAARTVLDRLADCTEKDLALFVFSGGGSALLPSCRPSLEFGEKQAATRLLLECGAAIEEINTIRKHLSRSKGGALARAAWPATVISLFLSDVVGDRLDAVASGPTVPDPTSFSDCLALIERYRISERIPRAVLEFLQRGAEGLEPETPKPGDPAFERVQNLIVGNNAQALRAAAEKARSLGYHTLVLSSRIRGEAREVALVFSAIGKDIRETGQPIPAPACVLAGGETTVTVRGGGKGGRNQELALAAAIDLRGTEGISLMSVGTDGTDGPTDAAGAVVGGDTFKRAVDAGMDPFDYLDRNDSYHFFDSLGLLLKTGGTRTNVMDVIAVLVE